MTLRETLHRRQLGLDGVLRHSCPPSSSCETGPATVPTRRVPVFSRPSGELGLCLVSPDPSYRLTFGDLPVFVILSRLPLNQSHGVNGVVPEKVNTFFLNVKHLKTKYFYFNKVLEITTMYKPRHWWGAWGCKNAQLKVFPFCPVRSAVSFCTPWGFVGPHSACCVHMTGFRSWQS